METTEKELTTEERHERVVAFLKRHVAEKRRHEEEMVENYKKDKRAQEIVAQLRAENDKR